MKLSAPLLEKVQEAQSSSNLTNAVSLGKTSLALLMYITGQNAKGKEFASLGVAAQVNVQDPAYIRQELYKYENGKTLQSILKDHAVRKQKDPQQVPALDPGKDGTRRDIERQYVEWAIRKTETELASSSPVEKAMFQRNHGMSTDTYISAIKEDYVKMFPEAASLKVLGGMLHPLGNKGPQGAAPIPKTKDHNPAAQDIVTPFIPILMEQKPALSQKPALPPQAPAMDM